MELPSISWSALGAYTPDLVCLSHLRWDFVFQRPQHLLSRCARDRRVFFVEEPVWHDHPAHMQVRSTDSGVRVAVPHLPHGLSELEVESTLKSLIDQLMRDYDIHSYALWYYTPMSLSFTSHLTPLVTIYDCMDELSMFKFAHPLLRPREQELMRRADVVFTGGHSLYEAKKHQHPNIHPFPSSVDAAHFARARSGLPAPEDQARIPGPRIGFFGVIDERMDIALVDRVAAARPDWSLVMLGPVVKIDPADLPRRDNIFYLGGKKYEELPAYISGWDVAMLPFARNDSTRFISPTKTPEYLAAGRPVVSTSIRDVVNPYEGLELVRIADAPEEFVAAIEASLQEDAAERLRKADQLLATTSWDDTWKRMSEVIEAAVKARVPGHMPRPRLTGDARPALGRAL